MRPAGSRFRWELRAPSKESGAPAACRGLMEASIKKEAETELKGGPEEGFFQKNERNFTNCSNFLKVLFKFSGYDTDILS